MHDAPPTSTADRRRAVDGGRAGAALQRFALQLAAVGVLEVEFAPRVGGGWSSLAAWDELPAWHAQLAATQHRRAAAATVATWVAAAPALTVGLPAVHAGAAPRVALDGLRVRRGPEGTADAYGLTPTAVAGGRESDVLVTAADTIAELTAPLVAGLCDRLPVGPAVTWGMAADALASYALWFARCTGADEQLAWRRTERLLDRLAERTPLRTRPRLVAVSWSGGTSHYPVRGTCCLYHRNCGPTVAADERYCATCPLRSDADRATRLVTYLERTS